MYVISYKIDEAEIYQMIANVYISEHPYILKGDLDIELSNMLYDAVSIYKEKEFDLETMDINEITDLMESIKISSGFYSYINEKYRIDNLNLYVSGVMHCLNQIISIVNANIISLMNADPAIIPSRIVTNIYNYSLHYIVIESKYDG